ncbi:retroviral-like aspartic protease family protein [Pseudenhygromyxa sp. WMMC2535]|uniref:aspartyl protease family protein n=1 Tax=Pseudenhygromyxa sp. WMMC2535 TaxID=2712867 RepID=UPI0015534A2B|nr:retroviral-like aspartic protease family protein [Pseudenhygromyxa sp. WMMC2535]
MAGTQAKRSVAAGEALSVLAALGWVMLSLASLLVGLVALLTAFSLARSANGGAHVAWLWLLAGALTFGIPCAFAAWKHVGEPRRIRSTMTWLPGLWNAGGLIIATLLVPDLVGTSLRSCEWVVQGRLGDAHPATRALSALGHEAADVVDPGGGTLPAPEVANSRVALDGDIVVPFSDEGAAIFLSVELEGYAGSSASFDYLFDTGASYTTITSKTAAALGIDVPEDAPTLEFNTASGLRESRMVHLPALRLGDVRIPGLLVSVCDSCATDRTAGLLGLNVMREFLVEMDYQGDHMRLIPRIHEGRPNRAYDIEPVLTMQVEGRPEIWLGRIRWVVTMTNNGDVPLYDVMPRVDFADGPRLYGERVERIDPGETGRSLLVGQVTEDDDDGGSVEFTLMLAEAYW